MHTVTQRNEAIIMIIMMLLKTMTMAVVAVAAVALECWCNCQRVERESGVHAQCYTVHKCLEDTLSIAIHSPSHWCAYETAENHPPRDASTSGCADVSHFTGSRGVYFAEKHRHQHFRMRLHLSSDVSSKFSAVSQRWHVNRTSYSDWRKIWQIVQVQSFYFRRLHQQLSVYL